MGKTSHKEKTPPGDFQVTTPKNHKSKSRDYKYKEFYPKPSPSQSNYLQYVPHQEITPIYVHKRPRSSGLLRGKYALA